MIKKLLLSILCLILAITVIVLIGIDVFTPYVDHLNTDAYLNYQTWQPDFNLTYRTNFNKQNEPEYFAHYKKSDTSLTILAKYYELNGVPRDKVIFAQVSKNNSLFSPYQSTILYDANTVSDPLLYLLPYSATLTITDADQNKKKLELPIETIQKTLWKPLFEKTPVRWTGNTLAQIPINESFYTLTLKLTFDPNNFIETIVKVGFYKIESEWYWMLEQKNSSLDYYAPVDAEIKALVTNFITDAQ